MRQLLVALRAPTTQQRIDAHRQQRPVRGERIGQERALARHQRRCANPCDAAATRDLDDQLIDEQQRARVVQVERERADDEQDVEWQDHSRLFFLPTSDFNQTPTPTRPASTSFHAAARNAAMAPKKPFFAATAAAPPATSAARPYSAT